MGEDYQDEALAEFNNNMINPSISQTRAYIKIQDGCNRFCSYCIIPYIRGRSVSRDLTSIHNEAKELAKYYNEIVLVGIDVSDYKIEGVVALPKLFETLKDVDARIRLSSVEVSAITDEFLKVLQSMPNFAPHFHLSLQSGDDDILKKMNRKYTRLQYLQACELIYKYFPDANITTDIIVGFPFETEENFANTLDLAKKAKFGKIHAFPFSAKKGTVAANYPDINPEIKKDRMNRLMALADELQTEYDRRFIGKKLNVLIEEQEGEYLVGYSENYIKCYIDKNYASCGGDIKTFVGKKLFKEGLLVR